MPRPKVYNVSKEMLEELYWKEEMSTPEIANHLGVSAKVIYDRMKEFQIPRRNVSQSVSIARKKSEKCKQESKAKCEKMHEMNIIDFIPRWNNNLAYILGVIDGDGWISKGAKPYHYKIGLETKDEVFAHKFVDSLRGIGLNPGTSSRMRCHNYNGYNWTTKLNQVWASSKRFIEWFQSLSEEEKFNILISSNKLAWKYIEGVYESDGSIYKYNLYISCTKTTRRKFLSKLFNWLELDFSCSNPSNIYIRSKSRETFFNNINPCIKNLNYKV